MLNKFDQFTKIENFQGRNYSEIPYELRVALYTQLTPEEHKQFELGRADAEVIKKAQAIYENFYEEVNPTEETLLKRRAEIHANIEFQTLNIELKNKKERLARLDHDAELDIPLPIGARKQLKVEIAQLEKQLQLLKQKNETIDSTESDWLDSFFTE